MKKQKARIAARKGLQIKIEDWCKQNNLEPDADGVIAFDKAFPAYGLLDHEKAQKEGYYLHLRSQAAAVIATWAHVVVLKAPGGSSGSLLITRRDGPVKVQDYYGGKKLSKMTERELDNLIADFQFFIRNKTIRVYHFLNLKNALQENRGRVQEAMKQAEEAAYSSVK